MAGQFGRPRHQFCSNLLPAPSAVRRTSPHLVVSQVSPSSAAAPLQSILCAVMIDLSFPAEVHVILASFSFLTLSAFCDELKLGLTEDISLILLLCLRHNFLQQNSFSSCLRQIEIRNRLFWKLYVFKYEVSTTAISCQLHSKLFRHGWHQQCWCSLREKANWLSFIAKYTVALLHSVIAWSSNETLLQPCIFSIRTLMPTALWL